MSNSNNFLESETEQLLQRKQNYTVALYQVISKLINFYIYNRSVHLSIY